MPKLEQALPMVLGKLWDILKKSIGGFLGVTGFLLSLILVPIYLFFLLNEKPRIQQRWKEYLPLRASPFRDEVAEVLSEINRYVTAYFRGQLLVCLVDGILIGTVLTIFPRSQFCAGDWCARCHSYDGSLYRHHHLLGASRSDRSFSMGRLDASHDRDRHFHPDTKSRRHILRSADCRKLCRIASDDGDRVDLSLGSDHWWGNRSTPCGAAHSDDQGTH